MLKFFNNQDFFYKMVNAVKTTYIMQSKSAIKKSLNLTFLILLSTRYLLGIHLIQ